MEDIKILTNKRMLQLQNLGLTWNDPDKAFIKGNVRVRMVEDIKLLDEEGWNKMISSINKKSLVFDSTDKDKILLLAQELLKVNVPTVVNAEYTQLLYDISVTLSRLSDTLITASKIIN